MRDHQSHGNGPGPVRVSSFGDRDLVYVAPKVFVPLDPKLDDGVAGLVKVLGGVFSGRVVAAAHMPADEAKAQVHPPTTRPQAHLATLCVGLHISNLINVLAF
jgi:hypothetical protein